MLTDDGDRAMTIVLLTQWGRADDEGQTVARLILIVHVTHGVAYLPPVTAS